jgi:hypothetical protein
MLKLSIISCTRFQSNYNSCIGSENIYVATAAAEALRQKGKTG